MRVSVLVRGGLGGTWGAHCRVLTMMLVFLLLLLFFGFLLFIALLFLEHAHSANWKRISAQ